MRPHRAPISASEQLTKIEREYGNGNLQTAYEYGYSGDRVRAGTRALREVKSLVKEVFGCEMSL